MTLVAVGHLPDQRRDLVVGDAEPGAVAPLEDHLRPQVRVDALEVTGVDREPPFVGLA